MTNRERLLEILNKPIFPHEMVDPLEAVADYLLDNGVTFVTDNNVDSKWIPVTERLPEYDGTYLVFTTSGTVTTARWYAEHDMRNYRGDFIRHVEGRFHRNVTHWMPLPEPPKEE